MENAIISASADESGKRRTETNVERNDPCENKARREAGLKVGDPREADHKTPLANGGSNSKSNIRVVSKKTNAQKEVQRKKREAKK